jgi:uncharacterized protein YbjT (DUF2867 family)
MEAARVDTQPEWLCCQTASGRGVEVVQGDLDDPGSLDRAAHCVYGIFSVQEYWVTGVRREVPQGKNLADIAKKTCVAHFVYSSVGGAERNTGIAPWETKLGNRKAYSEARLAGDYFDRVCVFPPAERR